MANTFLDMLSVVSTTFLALLFLRALWHKLSDFSRFSGFVAGYRLLPGALAVPAAAAFVVAKGAVIIMLAVPATLNAGAMSAAALLSLYATAIGINVVRGRTRIECGCGGPDQTVSRKLVLRNALLVLAALPAALVSPAPQGLPQILTGMAAGLLCWLLYSVAEALLANDGHFRLMRHSDAAASSLSVSTIRRSES